VLLGLLGGKVSCCMLWVAMCVVVCFRCQCVLVGLLVAMCVVVCLRWHCVFLGLSGGNVCCLEFSVAVCVNTNSNAEPNANINRIAKPKL